MEEPGPHRPGKLQADEPAVRFQDTPDFGEGLQKIPDVPDAETGGHGIEAGFPESQLFRVCAEAGDAASEPPARNFFETDLEHGQVQVHGCHPSALAHERVDQEGQIACAGADVHGTTGSDDWYEGRG